MKKRTRMYVMSLVFGMALGALVGCSSKQDSNNESSSKVSEKAQENSDKNTAKKSFVFCTNTLNNSFQSSMDAKFKELCDKNGISYTCLDPDYDLNKQLSQLSDCANSGYDAVFVIPVDSSGITAGLAEISDAKIPIYNVDTAVIEEDMNKYVTQFVGTNAFMAGELVGKQLVSKHPDGAKIAILDFPSNESCVDRVNGFMKGLGEQKDKFTIVAQQDGGAALDKSLGLAEDILTANSDLDAFFFINDPSALGAAAAIKASNKKGKVEVYSIDASPEGKQALLDGDFTAVAAQVPLQIAEHAFNEAINGEGKSSEKKVYLDSHLVDKEEAEKTLKDWQ